VGSILNYTSEVWCIGTIYNIEKVHFSFCKRVLNVKTSTSTLSIYSELGRYPLYANGIVVPLNISAILYKATTLY